MSNPDFINTNFDAKKFAGDNPLKLTCLLLEWLDTKCSKGKDFEDDDAKAKSVVSVLEQVAPCMRDIEKMTLVSHLAAACDALTIQILKDAEEGLLREFRN